MIKVQVHFTRPLFDKFEGRYVECLHSDASDWLLENVGPCDHHEGESQWFNDLPALKPGHWDVLRLGRVVLVRLPTEEHAVMFKLRWPENAKD